jgi:radical SAM superfamily enzyme YgiQ (UPF0313 family)
VDKVKYAKGGIFIALGGISPTVRPEYCLNNSKADAVIRGEGEYIFLELVNRLENKKAWRDIEGISFRKDGNIQNNPRSGYIEDLDALPFPARHLFPYKLYDKREFSDPMGRLITGRGCISHCIFCTAPIMHGDRIRSRSAKNIVDEIEYLIKEYNVKKFVFEDDTFTAKKELVNELCSDIIDRGIKAAFWCQTRVPNVNEELLLLMKKAGFCQVSFGIESGDDDVLKVIKKGINVSMVEKACAIAKKVKMPFSVNFMIGNIGETKKSVRKSIELAKKLDPFQVIFCIAIPFPGTKFRQICEENNWLIEPDTNKYHIQTKAVSRNNDLSAEDIKELYKKAYKEFYLRPKVMFRLLKECVKTKNYGMYLEYFRRWFNYNFLWKKK